jgi:hypothetical protein
MVHLFSWQVPVNQTVVAACTEPSRLKGTLLHRRRSRI